MVTTALMLSSVLAGLSSGGSHYPLSVVLWNDSAEGKAVGQNFTAWVQVYHGAAPSNATSVTFRFGIGVLSAIFPATSYPGVYAGSTGLYRASLNITAFDLAFGISALSMVAVLGNDTANTMRIIATRRGAASRGVDAGQ